MGEAQRIQIDALKDEKSMINEEDVQSEQIEKDRQEFVSKITSFLSDLNERSQTIHSSLKQQTLDSRTSVANYYKTQSNNNTELSVKRSLTFDEIKHLDKEMDELRNIFEQLSVSLIDDENCLLHL